MRQMQKPAVIADVGHCVGLCVLSCMYSKVFRANNQKTSIFDATHALAGLGLTWLTNVYFECYHLKTSTCPHHAPIIKYTIEYPVPSLPVCFVIRIPLTMRRRVTLIDT